MAISQYIMALIWPYNNPSLPIPTLLPGRAEGSNESVGTISKYTNTCASDPLPYAHWGRTGERIKIPADPSRVEEVGISK